MIMKVLVACDSFTSDINIHMKLDRNKCTWPHLPFDCFIDL